MVAWWQSFHLEKLILYLYLYPYIYIYLYCPFKIEHT